jgi:hypothetical protein
MIKIHDAVKNILFSDEEALSALSNGYMNLSQYAKQIHRKVELATKKSVGRQAVVVVLSRLSKDIKKANPILQDVHIKNITTKSPVSEIVYPKTAETISKLSNVYNKIKPGADDFFTMTLSTMDITVLCSDRIRIEIEKVLKEKPLIVKSGLASLGISIDPKYYEMPNITFSLLRRIAQKRIPLAETVTTNTEIIFIFEQRYLGEIVSLYVI